MLHIINSLTLSSFDFQILFFSRFSGEGDKKVIGFLSLTNIANVSWHKRKKLTNRITNDLVGGDKRMQSSKFKPQSFQFNRGKHRNQIIKRNQKNYEVT